MCPHSTLQDGFCVECGIQITDLNSITYSNINNITYSNTYINTVHFSSLKHSQLITRLLHGLNILDYKSSILQEYSSKSFTSRLSMKDKLLLCTYKVLRDLSYPITFSDLEKYSTKIRSKWFKEYKYIPYSREYIRSLIERFNEKRSEGDCDFEVVEDMIVKYSNHPIEKVIQAYIKKEELKKRRPKIKK